MANIKRIRKVVRFIEEKTAKSDKFIFNMREWFLVVAPDDDMSVMDRHYTLPYRPYECGTHACLAGWTVFASGSTIAKVDGLEVVIPKGSFGFDATKCNPGLREVEEFAARYLDLDDDQSDFIFNSSDFPNDLTYTKWVIMEALEDWTIFPEASIDYDPFPSQRCP